MSKQPWNAGRSEGTGDGHVDHLLSSYIDNDLHGEARSQVLAHLHECADCRAAYVELQATRKLLGRLPTVPPPRAFTITPEIARAASPRRAVDPSFWDRLLSRRNAPRFAFGSLVAVALTAFALVSALLSGTVPSEYSATASIQMAPAGSSGASAGQPPAAFDTGSATDSAAKQHSLLEATSGTTAAGATSTPAAIAAAQATSTTAAAMAAPTSSPAAPVVAEAGTAVPQPNSALQSTQNAGPTTTILNERTTISPPAPAPAGPAASQGSGLTAGKLALSMGVLLGVLSILLAAAAMISTRRRA